jgi:hypothetical protein
MSTVPPPAADPAAVAEALLAARRTTAELETQAALLKDQITSLSETNAIYGELLTNHSAIRDLNIEDLKKQKQVNDLQEKQIELSRINLNTLQKQLDVELSTNNANSDEAQRLLTQIVHEEKLLQLAQEQQKARKQMGQEANDLLALMGLGTAYKDTFVGKLLTLGDKEWESGLEEYTLSLKKAFEKPEELLKGNVGVKLTELLVTVTAEMASAFAELNKTSSNALNNFVNLSAAMNASGVGMENAKNAVGALNKNFSLFSELSYSSSAEISRTTAQLDKLGFSAESSSKLLVNLSTGFGMSATQAANTMTDIVQLADDLSMSVGELGTQFEQVSGKLSAYGARGVTVFKELAATAKASGVEINTLVSIAEKMDTFQGAAESAGKLNAVLGGGLLNASQLLNATESERIRLIAESVQASGRSFESLSKYEKLTIASAAGISDLSQANKIFGMSMSQLDGFQAKAAASEKNALTMTEALAEATTLFDSLKLVVFSLVKGMAPFIVLLTMVVNILLHLNEFLGGALLPTLGFLITTTMLVGHFSRITAIFQSIFAASNMSVGFSAMFARTGLMGFVAILLVIFGVYHMTGSPMLYLIGFTMALSIIAIGMAAKISEKQLYALGVAMLGIGVAVFAAFYGLKMFAEAMSKLNGPQLLAFTFALVVFLGVILLMLFAQPAIPVLGAIAVALLMVGASFFLFGAGAALAGVGLKMIFESLTTLAAQGTNLILLAVSLYAITGAIGTLLALVSNPIGMIGMGVLIVSFAALAATLSLMASSATPIINLITALSNVPENLATRLAPLAETISQIAESINEINSNSANSLSNALNSLTDLGEATIKLQPQNVETVSKLVNEADRYRNVVNNTRTETNSLLTNLISTVTSTSGGSSATPVNVSLQLDKLNLGKAIFNMMEDKMGLNINRPRS